MQSLSAILPFLGTITAWAGPTLGRPVFPAQFATRTYTGPLANCPSSVARHISSLSLRPTFLTSIYRGTNLISSYRPLTLWAYNRERSYSLLICRV